MGTGARGRIALVTVTAVLVAPGAAHATVTIGSNLGREPNVSLGCSPACTVAADALESDRQAANGIRSPVNGTVFQWRVRAAAQVGPTAFRVIKHLGGGLATGAGTSATVTPAPNATSAFLTQLPIAIGDSVGIDCCQPTENYFVDSGGSRALWQPPLIDGGPGATNNLDTSREVALAADIEPTSSFTATVNAKRGGKVKITVDLPNPGTLVAGDKSKRLTAAARKQPKLLKTTTVPASGPGRLTLKVRATKAARTRLAFTGKRLKAGVKVVFTPLGGEASTQVIGVKLKP